VLRVEQLQLGDRLAELGLSIGLDEVDQSTGGIDSDLGLVEVALVVLGDPARGQVEDRDHALQDHVLDSDLADLLLELGPDLLLRRLLRPASP
jgi:hypothetical protein